MAARYQAKIETPRLAVGEPGPRRAAHPVHEHVASVVPRMHADMGIKQRARDCTTPPSDPPGQ